MSCLDHCVSQIRGALGKGNVKIALDVVSLPAELRELVCANEDACFWMRRVLYLVGGSMEIEHLRIADFDGAQNTFKNVKCLDVNVIRGVRNLVLPSVEKLNLKSPQVGDEEWMLLSDMLPNVREFRHSNHVLDFVLTDSWCANKVFPGLKLLHLKVKGIFVGRSPIQSRSIVDVQIIATKTKHHATKWDSLLDPKSVRTIKTNQPIARAWWRQIVSLDRLSLRACSSRVDDVFQSLLRPDGQKKLGLETLSFRCSNNEEDPTTSLVALEEQEETLRQLSCTVRRFLTQPSNIQRMSIHCWESFPILKFISMFQDSPLFLSLDIVALFLQRVSVFRDVPDNASWMARQKQRSANKARVFYVFDAEGRIAKME